MPDDAELFRVLRGLRERGALGEASLPDAVQHAEFFLEALPPSTLRLIDLGSGGGLPGLVLAARLPHLSIVLTDRRERRMDLLRMACVRLGFGERVSVLTGDVVDLARRGELAGTFDAVTSRAFGEPMLTARCARPFLAPGGVVVVSEPPDLAARVPGDAAVEQRWPALELDRLNLTASPTCYRGVRRIDLRRADP